jgi:hypothetical protein
MLVFIKSLPVFSAAIGTAETTPVKCKYLKNLVKTDGWNGWK